MQVLQHALLNVLGNLPVVGGRVKARMDKRILANLEIIEARFSSASVRFATQLHDLYDCLKTLQGPLEIDVKDFHRYVLVVHTKSSNDAARLLERLKVGAVIAHDEYYKPAGIGRHDSFLDWFSNEGSFNEFVEGVMWLLHIYCTNVSRATTEEGDPLGPRAECNEMTDEFMGSKWFKLLILDLIQALIVVFTQRTGG